MKNCPNLLQQIGYIGVHVRLSICKLLCTKVFNIGNRQVRDLGATFCVIPARGAQLAEGV